MPTQQQYLSRRWGSSIRVWLLVIGVLSPGLLSAQKASVSPKVAGSYVYEKLAKAQQAYEKAMASGDSLAIAAACYNLGKRYHSVGDDKKSQTYFVRSLQIREPRNQYEDVGNVYLFMSHHQMEQKKYADAKRLMWRALANFKKANKAHGLMSGNLVMGSVHALGYELNLDAPGHYPSYSLDSALYYFQQAETLAVRLKVPADIANVYHLKGLFLAKMKPELGLSYLKKAYALFRQENLVYPVISSSFSLAEIYLSMHQPAQASQWLGTAKYVIDTARQGDVKQRTQLVQSSTHLYEQTGQWEAALAAYKKYHDLTVETLNVDREGAIARIHIEYETQKKETQIATQRKLIGLMLALGVMALIASVVFYRFFQRYKQLSHLNAALVREQNHRVKNNFQEVINLLSLQANRLTNEDAQKAVADGLLRMEAMALVHQRLYASTDRLVEIDLASFIPDLIQGVLYSYSYEQLQPMYQLEPIWLHADQALPLGLIINELVTNACKYAFPQQETPILEVTCRLQTNTLRLEIMDHGPGFNAEKQYKSLGLKLIQAFTQRLDGQSSFGAKGNKFQLTFPIHISQPVH